LLAGRGGDDDDPAPSARTEPFERTPLREPGESGTLDESVCVRIRPREVARALRRPGLRLEPTANDSPDPQRRPYQVKGVGQDSAYGGAGAWWTRSKSQLVAYSRNRILRIRIVGGFGDATKRRVASRLGRLGFRRLSVPAS
jgi:hypothetical protein